jgi:cytochrome c553
MNLGLRRNQTTPRHEARGRRITKVLTWQLVLPLAVVAIAFAATNPAEARGMVSRQSINAKIKYCQDCHGIRGQGFRGYYPIPRLAGQQPRYLMNQLEAFIQRRRTNNIMFNVAHVLRPAMMSGIAERFRNFNPKPLGGAPRNLVARGRSIFLNGIPQRNVAACAACHGPNATGHGEIPRLAGQVYPYVVTELRNWTKERGQNPANPDTSAIMKPVAHSLTGPEIKAVAAYVSYLR